MDSDVHIIYSVRTGRKFQLFSTAPRYAESGSRWSLQEICYLANNFALVLYLPLASRLFSAIMLRCVLRYD